MQKTTLQASPQSSLRRFLRNPFVILLSAVVIFLISQVVGALSMLPLQQYMPENDNILLFTYALTTLVSLMVILTAAARVFRFSLLQHIGLRWPRIRHILEVFPAFLIYLFISIIFMAVVMQLFSGFDADQAQEIGFQNPESSWQLIVAFLSLAVITPLYEELIFRGMLFRGLRHRLPFWASAGVSSIVFAAAHGQWNVAVDTFVLGMMLSYLVERSNSVWPAVALHALKNAVAFLLLFIVRAG